MKKSRATFAAVFVSAAIVSSGCSNASEPNAAKNGNANQTTAVINTNVAVSVVNNTVAAASPNANAPLANTNNPAASAGNKNNKPAPNPKEPTPQIGSGGNDFALFSQARSALSADKELSSAVIIEIKEGNITLSGSVSTEAQKAKAAQLIQSVSGVKSVKNNLRVAS